MHAYKEKTRGMNTKYPLEYKLSTIQLKKLKDNKEEKKSNNSYSYENRAKLTQGLLKKEKQIKYAQIPNTVNAQVGENSRLSIDDVSDMYKAGKTAQLKAVNITKSSNFLFNLGQAKYAENNIKKPIEKKTVPIQKKENKTGIPDNLRGAVESKSGISMDDVKVHYNSSKPRLLGALAYTQGTEIHVGPGQEKHLGHELGHVVQQKQGIVKPTMQMKGFAVNDDAGLEKKADEIGIGAKLSGNSVGNMPSKGSCRFGIVQMVKEKDKKKDDEKLVQALKRLRGSYDRNKIKKAKPKNRRAIYKLQRINNYGFINKTTASKSRGRRKKSLTYNPNINPKYKQFRLGGAGGYYRKGFSGQPFLYLQSELYDDPMIKSNYDSIIAQFKGKDSEIALELLNIIKSGGKVGTTVEGQAKSLMVFLTQIIEPHESRIPGSDKLARALFRRIAAGELTFEKAFNRRNGIFVSAWATAAKAPKGGQTAARALFGAPPKKNDKFSFDDIRDEIEDSGVKELVTTVNDYYSDDSDGE